MRLALAVALAAAPMPLPSTHVGATSRFIGSDGTRFAAWQGTDVATTVVYDAATRRTMRVTPPTGCAVTGIGAGALLATCDAEPLLSAARVLSLRTGLWREVVPAVSQLSGFNPYRSFIAIGARWIQASMQDYHSSVSAFYSRATGAEFGGRAPYGPHSRPDLDRAGLRAPLCAPLAARSSGDTDDFDGYIPPQVDGRFALDAIDLAGIGRVKLVLRHCGTTLRRVICRPWCASPVLYRGQVLWADDFGRLHVRGVRGRRTRVYALRGGHEIDDVYAVGSHLIFATDRLSGIVRAAIRVVPLRALRTP